MSVSLVIALHNIIQLARSCSTVVMEVGTPAAEQNIDGMISNKSGKSRNTESDIKE